MDERPSQSANQKRVRARLSGKRRLCFSFILVAFNLLILAGVYVGSVAWRCREYAGRPKRWIGSAYQPDEQFGSFPKPHHIAYQVLQDGEHVPVLFDDNGFRIPVQNPTGSAPAEESKILFLGCSFTHGYSVPAEKTFAYLAARKLNASCLNAGGSGWGLAHMVLRARREIPKAKPSWVVVQYSNWLVDRSMRVYRSSALGKVPTPYVFQQDGEFLIHAPVFTSGSFRVPIADFADRGNLAFMWHVGLPLFLYDDFHVLQTSVRHRLGRLPLPTTSREAIVRFAFSEIYRLCQEHGARMLVVKVSPNEYSASPYRDDLPALGYGIADTYPALVDHLLEPSSTSWQTEYCIWRGSPPVLVDSHPNEKAHEVMSQVIVEAIRSEEGPMRRRDESVGAAGGAGDGPKR